MRALLSALALLSSGVAAGCAEPAADPPPPAPKYGLVVAPPGALGAHAASRQIPGAAALEPEYDDGEELEGDEVEEDLEGPTPDVAPEEGVPL